MKAAHEKTITPLSERIDSREVLGGDVPVLVPGDGPGHHEGEDARLAGIAQAQESV